MASLVQHPFRRIRRFTRTRSRVEVLFVVIWVLAWVTMGSTKWISPAGRASARAASPVQRVRMSPADASSAGLRFTSIGCSTNGVELSVSWDGGAFALPPFLEFFARTNLVAGGWELVGWTQAEMGETNLDVVVGADRLPGGADTVPSAAFFSVTASDGLGDDWADDDNDGVPNAVEQARGTNPRRADTDGDGYPDGEEVAYAATGRELPDFDLSDLPDAFAGTLPYATYPAAIAVDLPFAVELAGRRSTRAIVHFCGTVTFPVVGSTVNAQNYAISTRPSSLYAASHAVVAAYGLMFMPMGYSGSQLRAGIVHASNGRWFVAEWRNMMDAAGFTQLSPGYATFRLAVAEAEPGTVHVRYLSLTGGLDGTDALVGAHGFNGAPDLLVSDGVPGSVSSGDVISYRFGTGTDPLDPDTDGDGLRDGWEAEHGMDPRVPNDASDPRLAPDADPDNDGLANRRESELGTDPFQPDSDNDGLDDGWESRYADFGFDPLVPNVNGAVENTGPDEDLDGDGLTNREECEWGTDPGEPDTDRDGVPDGTEVAQSGDPADAEDGGRPNSRVLATLTLGDHSRSQSEKSCLTFTPVPNSGPGGVPAAISRISARYDGCAPLTVPLKPGWRYEVRLDHAGSDPAYTGTPKPDYDYTLEFSPKPESVLLDDPQGLFGVHGWDDGPFLARDKAATATVYRLEFVTPAGDPVAAPKSSLGDGQNEFTYDDATSSLDLSLKVRVLPSLPSEWATRMGTFSLPSIEGVTLEWTGGSNGRASATGNEFTARATYRGYPTHNGGFGRKTATFTLGGLTVSQDFEVFFPKFGKNHPACPTCPNCSNWFYYWREGDVCSIPENARWSTVIDGITTILGKYDPEGGVIILADVASNMEGGEFVLPNVSFVVTNVVYLVDHEPTSDNISVMSGSQGIPGHRYFVRTMQSQNEVRDRILSLGGTRKGIACVAAVIAHEQCHADIQGEASRQLALLDECWNRRDTAEQTYGKDSLEYAMADRAFRQTNYACPDDDGDHVYDGGEKSAYKGLYSREDNPDTYGIAQLPDWTSYRAYGDDEVRARLLETNTSEDRYHVDCDWSNPGCQHETPFGP